MKSPPKKEDGQKSNSETMDKNVSQPALSKNVSKYGSQPANKTVSQ